MSPNPTSWAPASEMICMSTLAVAPDDMTSSIRSTRSLGPMNSELMCRATSFMYCPPPLRVCE
eukprot:CAMPEP_0181183032 /NCGR_PEP_ID=MMETSP1096-20121128/8204_1 /TAXON_ID=156174 ORGANISM="Chrysochromulina ericina, Strain CCMP281" /NCGR_SAMPLE_ID=MMETSP1096 /ASSEMBLY_ACC=CAM_ASM_000453 /LENGTH=62 /DNA_ID=CAMNT_0023271675 /DNA_START=561 /DNA_END=749 /DNA_ORIENTATION=+